MRVLSLGESLGEYQDGVAMLIAHDVSVTTARMYGEAACVVSV